VKRFGTLRFIGLGLVLASMTCSAADISLVKDDFSAKSDRWIGGEIVDGTMSLSVQGKDSRFNGSRLLLVPPVRIPPDGVQALHLSFTLVGFAEVTGAKNYKAAARIFLMPEPLPKFVEPYSAPNVFVLIVTYAPRDGTTLALYRKLEGDKGFGKPLYEGSLEPGQFPVKVDMYLTRTLYRIRFDRDVLSDRGSLSGYHELPESVWGGDLRFGTRIINESEGMLGRVIFDDFEASTSGELR
jgi:hypothetical protein